MISSEAGHSSPTPNSSPDLTFRMEDDETTMDTTDGKVISQLSVLVVTGENRDSAPLLDMFLCQVPKKVGL